MKEPLYVNKPLMIARSNVEQLFPGLNPKTLANLNSKGEGPRGFKRGRLVFYRVDEITRYFEANPIGGKVVKNVAT